MDITAFSYLQDKDKKEYLVEAYTEKTETKKQCREEVIQGFCLILTVSLIMTLTGDVGGLMTFNPLEH